MHTLFCVLMQAGDVGDQSAQDVVGFMLNNKVLGGVITAMVGGAILLIWKAWMPWMDKREQIRQARAEDRRKTILLNEQIRKAKAEDLQRKATTERDTAMALQATAASLATAAMSLATTSANQAAVACVQEKQMAFYDRITAHMAEAEKTS